MKQRGFEIISKYQEEGLSVPQRATKGAAGYDFQAAETVVVPSLWKLQQAGENPKPILVKTGIKAYMPDSEYLELAFTCLVVAQWQNACLTHMRL